MVNRIVCFALAALMAAPVEAGGFARVVSGCSTCAVQPVYSAPVVSHSYAVKAVPNYYYQVGAQLQQQAQDTHGFRNSAEWAEFLQLRGYKQGTEQMLSAVHAAIASGGRQPVSYQPPPEQPQQPPAGPPPENAIPQAPANPATPPSEPIQPPAGQEVKYPTLAKTCASCHTGESPKGDVWLDGSVDLSGPDAAEVRERIVRSLWLGHMPPDKPADDATVGQILSEIFVE